MVKKIVLTGGPCSGKTTVLCALRDGFGEKIIFVPEVATLLLAGGFPTPGKHLKWSEKWQAAFQAAVLPLQEAIEDAHALMAAERGDRLMICDRGVLDGAAYTPGGVAEFCNRYAVDHTRALTRYEAVIHLESLATTKPEMYGKAGNDSRFEPLERAQELERATRAAWQDHPRHIVVDGRHGIEGKVSQVRAKVRALDCALRLG